MNIIICGPDGAGKTKLAVALSKIFNYSYIRFPSEETVSGKFLQKLLNNRELKHEISPIGLALIFIQDIIEANQLYNFDRCVCDRLWLSTIIYNGLKIDFSLDNFWEFQGKIISNYCQKLIQQPSIMIILDAPDEILDQRVFRGCENGVDIKWKHDIDFDKEYQKRIRYLYRQFGTDENIRKNIGYNNPVIYLDTTGNHEQLIIETVNKIREYQKTEEYNNED